MRGGSSGRGGWMTVVLLVFAVAVLDFSPMLSLFDQAPLAEFVSSVGLELLKQYVDRTVQSGVYSPAASDASVQNALTVLRMASNLTGSPKYAGRASISLGDVQSRHLGEWKAALVSYRRAEELLPYSVIPKYQISRCYVELGLYETAADKLREVIRTGAEQGISDGATSGVPHAVSPSSYYATFFSSPSDEAQERYIYGCLSPFELAKLIFGPTNKENVVERAKRLVHVQDGDIEITSEGLSRAVTLCPPSLQQAILPYKSLSEWNLPKEGKKKSVQAKAPTGRRDRKRKTKAGQVKKVVAGFLEFIESSGLKGLTTDLVAVQSDTVVQVGAPLTWMDEPHDAVPPLRVNSQPLQQEHVVNSLVHSDVVATPVQSSCDEGSLVVDSMEVAHWHSGFTRLSLHEELFRRIDAIEASLEADCTQLRAVIHTYDAFIETHKRQIIPILEGDSRPLLATWKKHNQQLRSVCPAD